MAELFGNFEVNREKSFWEHLLRILAGSAVLHALLVLTIFYVPAVRDTLRIADTLAGIEFVDEDYTKGVIGERATMLTFDNPGDKLQYPPGYFSMAAGIPVATDEAFLSPEQQMPDAVFVASVPPSAPEPLMNSTTRAKPSASPSPTPSASPTPAASATPEVAANTTGTGSPSASPSPTPSEREKAEAEIDKLAAETNTKRFPRINSKPFKDLLAKGKEMKDRGELNLNGSLALTVEADRSPDGTLTNIQISGATGDPKLNSLAEEFILALSASKALAVLEDIQHLSMKLTLDESKVSVEVLSEAPSAERAAQMARGYNGMLVLGRVAKKGRDEDEILKNVSLSSKGSQLTVRFEMKRDEAGKMLSKQVPKAS